MTSRRDARSAFAQILLERIRNDQHPSRTEMQILEATLPEEMVGDYLEVLLEKVGRGRPSITMLRHIQQLVA